MDGIFNLKTSKGNISLKVGKQGIYSFEKDRNQSLISLLTAGEPPNIEISWRNVTRSDIQIDLAFYCQCGKKIYSREELIEIADGQDLFDFLIFALNEYSNSFALWEAGEDKFPLPEPEVGKKNIQKNSR